MNISEGGGATATARAAAAATTTATKKTNASGVGAGGGGGRPQGEGRGGGGTTRRKQQGELEQNNRRPTKHNEHQEIDEAKPSRITVLRPGVFYSSGREPCWALALIYARC